MTKQEAAIIMAYTGTTLLTGEDFSIFHKYIEEKLKRPVLTYKLADKVVEEQIKEASKEDLINLCKNLENETTAQWDFVHYDPDYLVYSGTCTACGKMHSSSPRSLTSMTSLCLFLTSSRKQRGGCHHTTASSPSRRTMTISSQSEM